MRGRTECFEVGEELGRECRDPTAMLTPDAKITIAGGRFDCLTLGRHMLRMTAIFYSCPV
jgi:hypothetical protein